MQCLKQTNIKNILHSWYKDVKSIINLSSKLIAKSRVIKGKKKIEKNLLALEESLSKLKKHYDYDDIEYKGVREVGNLLNQSIDEDYCKSIKTTSVFDNTNNCMNMRVK